MILTTEYYVDKKGLFTQKTWRSRIMFGTPKTSFGDWKEGKEYSIFLQQMKNKRFCIYKGQAHFNEPSGYMAFDSMEELEQFFELKKDTEYVGEVELGKHFEVPEGAKVVNV